LLSSNDIKAMARGIFAARIALGDLSPMRPISQLGSVRYRSHLLTYAKAYATGKG
jgi:hypothetical protein